MVDDWLATTPAGIEIIIAREKAKAITTSEDLILRLEMFLTALVITPKLLHPPEFLGKKDRQE